MSGLRGALWKVCKLWNWEYKRMSLGWGSWIWGKREKYEHWLPLASRPPTWITMAGFGTLLTLGQCLLCPPRNLLGLQGSPGTRIASVGTTAHSHTSSSCDGLKGMGEVILVMSWLMVLLSLNQMSDNVMTLIKETLEVGEIEIGVLKYLSWKLGFFHLFKTIWRHQKTACVVIPW